MSTQESTAARIFLDAVEDLDPERRSGLVNDACQGNSELRARVLQLLKAHDQRNALLDDERGIAVLELTPLEKPGAVIGPYKLLQQIGEGAFGAVFVAEQDQPVKRRLALKVIKPGMDTRDVISRFEAERQALAMMDHPYIAKVYDAGATETGRPYFVMELVQGVPITEYCDQCNLTTNERLALFVTVCQAVQHAHQKGVIHRDLKPTNVLVAMQDGKATPKIIDFGVAKAIGEQSLTERTLTTAFAQMIGTPLYMSPEQAELSPLGVDTRSDIYSLGVMLYELLTGATPFDKDRLHAASYDELRRIIREEEPPQPSARLSSLRASATAGETAKLVTTIAEKRRTDARRLVQAIRGELDWIIMKCLEKDRDRRYDSAGSLARDVERYLHNEPVQACPPSIPYRLKKFVRRNKAAAAIVAAILIGTAGLGISNFAIKRERDAKTVALARASAVSDLLQKMLGSADADRAKGADYKVRELLDEYSAGMGGQLADQPEVAADIHATIGRAYRSLRAPEQAQPHFERAIHLLRRLDSDPNAKLAAVLVDYGWCLHDQQRYDEAEAQLNEALEIYRNTGVTGGPLVHALEIQQHIFISAGRDADAERVTQQAMTLANLSNEEFPDQANLLHRYAEMRIRQGDYAEGERLARQAIDMHRRLQGEQHPETGWALRTLARALVPQQKLADAEQALRDSLAIFRRQFPEGHPNISDTRNELRTVLHARDDNPALKSLAEEEADQALRSDSPEYQIRLAQLLLTSAPLGDSHREEAHRLLRRAIDACSQVPIAFPSDYRRRMTATENAVAALETCASMPDFAKETDRLNRLLSAELPQFLTAFPGSASWQWETAMGYRSWGRTLNRNPGCLSVVERAYSEAIDILEKASLSVADRRHLWFCLANSYSRLGECRWRQGVRDGAEAAFRSATDVYDEHAEAIAADLAVDPQAGLDLEIVLDRLGFAFFLADTGREEEAGDIARKTIHDATRLVNGDESIEALWLCALAQLRSGDHASYQAACEALLAAPDPHDDLSRYLRLWTFCLAADAIDDLSAAVTKADDFLEKNTLNNRHTGLTLLGAALYRAGRYDEAVDRLQESIDEYPAEPLPGFDTLLYQQLLLAMSEWRRGSHDEARRMLAEALPAVDEQLRTPSILIQRRATLEILRRQAIAIVETDGKTSVVDDRGDAQAMPANDAPLSHAPLKSKP